MKATLAANKPLTSNSRYWCFVYKTTTGAAPIYLNSLFCKWTTPRGAIPKRHKLTLTDLFLDCPQLKAKSFFAITWPFNTSTYLFYSILFYSFWSNLFIYIYIYIYIRGGMVHVFVPNRHGTDLSVRCMRPYDEYRQFTPNPEGAPTVRQCCLITANRRRAANAVSCALENKAH